jgi:dTDP-4-dehydrorhamnose 3,5-epimerase
MKVTKTSLVGVLILEPRVFSDARGTFVEGYNERLMADFGVPDRFVQDNQSYSRQSVVRGLHYQISHPQGKLVRVVAGEILDVAVDLRRSSATFGKWHGVTLSGENHLMLWIPPGFAHGFHVLSDGAHVLYKTTDFYDPQSERTLAWNDAELKIEWKLSEAPVVSEKDARGKSFGEAEKFE